MNSITQHLTADRLPGYNKWSTLIDFLVSLETDGIFTRQELLNYMSTKGFNSKSIDTYKNYLTKAGYLETISRGIYVIKRRIPYHTSVSEVRQKAYGLILDYNLIEFKNGSVFTTPFKKQLKKKPEEFIKKEEMQI